ncbi:Ref family recombination enhancement nuclease [Luteibacter sp. NPDC031894]|uniref:Ref family recombination enhancement nuclease n=1 Tax=Luteibacter sp. NPDC031894 TaxID=3390572 RepID=UPI003CFD7006
MKRGKPLTRRTCLVARAGLARGRWFRSGRSTGKPTKAQAERIDRLKHGECICCWINRQQGRATAYFGGCDAHHVLRGGRRIGHDATLAACAWHHRGVKPYEAMTDAQATEIFGPSLAHGSKPFHAMYGSDQELLELQETLLTMETP